MHWRRISRINSGSMGYTPNPIRLSRLLKGARNLGIELKETGEFERLMSFMDGGDRIREKSGSGEILALWAMASIKNKPPPESPVRRRTAYILRSIKHPDEARALRAVYGGGFFLIGLSASTAQRKWSLTQKGLTEDQAKTVIERDESEERVLGHKLGQQTREALRASRRIHPPARNPHEDHRTTRTLPSARLRCSRRNSHAR